MNGSISFNSFPSESIELDSFDWVNGSENRNWWWQIQQLPVNRWYVNGFDSSTDENQHRLAQTFLLRVLRNWARHAPNVRGNIPLTWHDHAAALRLRGLRDLYVVASSLDSYQSDLQRELEVQIEEHCLWLEKPENYSVRTNHGFDQADILLFTALVFPDWKHSSRLARVARLRLLDEITFAFTNQGVHKENSPGYHQFMMSRLEQLLVYETFGDPELGGLARRYFENSRRFLGAISLPDRTLPAIGDTRLGTPVNPDYLPADGEDDLVLKANEGHMRIHDFAESGYLMVDYIDARTNELGKLILKSGQFSRYHRQDDDLSIHWIVGNRVLLDDAGLYSHNENDPVRLYARSSYAHSTLIVAGSTPKRSDRTNSEPVPLQIKTEPLRLIATSSSVPHWKLRRVVNIQKLAQGRLVVECQARSASQHGSILTNWLLSPHFSVANFDTPSGQALFKDAEGYSLSISPEDSVEGSALYAGKGTGVTDTAVTSRVFGEYETTTRLVSQWPGPGTLRSYLYFGVPTAVSSDKT
ncbi:heparinase II/III family protein [Arthrobacter sp. PAMC25284]|uniref:heparinase II/III family protein n=1 Tax=Arthrobacter sp. PAMC25284 TaxID=2861279 RepID=UPI001C630988|nr:heparinase II/III family protein [Arthrobacter sp. PAMC25284]QYF89896.1 heparinase II/III family protein [Arthrobacter sp. PAMC25284]